MRRFCFLSVCVSLSLFLSLSLCFHLSVCFSVCLSLCLSVPLSLCLCVSVSPSVSVSPPISQLCLYLYSLSPPDTPATPPNSPSHGFWQQGPGCGAWRASLHPLPLGELDRGKERVRRDLAGQVHGTRLLGLAARWEPREGQGRGPQGRRDSEHLM